MNINVIGFGRWGQIICREAYRSGYFDKVQVFDFKDIDPQLYDKSYRFIETQDEFLDMVKEVESEWSSSSTTAANNNDNEASDS